MSNADDERNLALAVVLRYVLAEENYNNPYRKKIAELAKEIGVDDKVFTRFLQQQERFDRQGRGRNPTQDSNSFFDKCRNYLKNKLEKKRDLPDYIRQAISVAFPDPDHATSPSKETGTDKVHQNTTPLSRPVDAIASLFSRFASEDNDAWKKAGLAKALGGKIYDVYRWSAPSRHKHVENKGPRVVRAAAKFIHAEKSDGFPRFLLSYCPHHFGSSEWTNWMSSNPESSQGVVLPLGSHYLMVGLEERSNYPLFIYAEINLHLPGVFPGLVVRRADSKPQIFASRVVFRENLDTHIGPPRPVGNHGGEDGSEPRVKTDRSLSEIKDLLGITYAADLPEGWINTGVLDLLEGLRNSTNHDGQSALTLKKEKPGN
jgi:hypothetical protein